MGPRRSGATPDGRHEALQIGEVLAEDVADDLEILAGASPMHDAAAAADVARRVLRHGTVKVYAEASHAINGERPAEIAADLAAHVASADPAPVRR